MQNHLDSSSSRGGTFSGMLSSGTDPCFGDPHGSHHDFTTLNGSSGSTNGQTEFGHLLNTTQQQHHHHHSQQHPETNNNTTNHNSNTTKPKKVPPPNGKKTKGRVKIKMEFIDNKLRRYTTFSKRKTGIMKKAYELSTLTGTQVMLLVASETGHVYTFATRKLQPMITSEAGKALIQTCLNSPDPPNSGDAQRMSATGYEETELTYAADPNGSDHGDIKVRLTSSPYPNPPQSLAPLHHSHSPSMYGSPLNNSYHTSPGVISSGGMIFPHSPSPNSGMLYHYPSDPQPPQCYPSGLHSPTSPHLTHLAR